MEPTKELFLKLIERLKELPSGLDPDLLESWYRVIEVEAKRLCPEHLRDSISVTRDPILGMKFELKASRRAVPYLLEAIEENLAKMPPATRLYFQKLGAILEEECFRQAYK